jgi:hypothetical protein
MLGAQCVITNRHVRQLHDQNHRSRFRTGTAARALILRPRPGRRPVEYNVMLHADMDKPASPTAPEPKRPQSPLQGSSIILLYGLAAAIAMAGWLWLLAWLTWYFVAWLVSAVTFDG